MLPARAGMTPRSRLKACSSVNAPRTRGDDPCKPPAPMPGGLTHRGWTLVDAAGGWRCAVRGAERIRVCREHTDTNAARRLFRARVDERMAREEGA